MTGERAGARPPTSVPGVVGPGAVLFDLDGVLVDTEPWWHAERAAWAARRGRPWTEADSRACMGQTSRDWAVTMRDRAAVADDPADIEHEIVAGLVARYEREPAPAVPGAPAAAARIAARLPTAIVSSAHPAVIRAALAATGLAGVFTTVVSSDDVGVGKPAPDVYLEAARRLAVEPAACLVVEDSANGVRAGRAAGMRVVLVPNPSVPPGPGAFADADVVVTRLADLPLEPEAAP